MQGPSNIWPPPEETGVDSFPAMQGLPIFMADILQLNEF